MRQGLTLGLLILVCAGLLVGWNASRFVGAKPRPRSKDLDFLPAPVVAQILSMGQRSTVAKLRWIDSFAYFEYQLDRKDDTVSGDGGTSGFVRLYDTLIALDPYFQPFYEHAALNVGGVLGRHWQSLAFLERGLLALPHSTELWRNAAAELKVHFNWEEGQPQSFDAFLAAWADAEETENGKRMVFDWKKSMGGRKFKDLEQLPYWLDRLQATVPKTPMGDYVESVIRTQLATYGQRHLSGLVALYRRRVGTPTFRSVMEDLKDSSIPLAEQMRLGPVPEHIEQILRRELLVEYYRDRLPAFGPITLSNGRWMLRPDPYGFSWRIDGAAVVSPGLEHGQFDGRLGAINSAIESKAKEHGAWPGSLDEVHAWGVEFPPVPVGGSLRLEDKWVTVDWSKPDAEPWKLR